MHIGILGINHKLADLSLREKIAKACDSYFKASDISKEKSSLVLLSTCNRTEIYFSSDDLALTHSQILYKLRHMIKQDFEHKLYSYFGKDCFTHLAHVTAGLDSAILGETEIQGQVKKSYETASSQSILPYDLHFLFQKCLKIGKEVRTRLKFDSGVHELEHALFHAGTHFFSNHHKASILFIGASDINKEICSFFKIMGMEDLTLCNRSYNSSEKMAKQFGLKILHWKELALWKKYDWLIFATKSPSHLIEAEQVQEKFEKNKLIIDLSVPRNVDPKIGKHSNITLLNIDQINRSTKKARSNSHTFLLANRYVHEEAYRMYELFLKKQIRVIEQKELYNLAVN